MPYPRDVNDIPSIVARRDSVGQFCDMIVDDFDERPRQVRDGVAQVMGIALHPYIVGQPYRMRALSHVASHGAARRDVVWPCRAGDVWRHAAGLPEGSVA